MCFSIAATMRGRAVSVGNYASSNSTAKSFSRASMTFMWRTESHSERSICVALSAMVAGSVFNALGRTLRTLVLMSSLVINFPPIESLRGMQFSDLKSNRHRSPRQLPKFLKSRNPAKGLRQGRFLVSAGSAREVDRKTTWSEVPEGFHKAMREQTCGRLSDSSSKKNQLQQRHLATAGRLSDRSVPLIL